MPSWFDLRFVLGVVLVLGSVVVGARLFAVADKTVLVWAVARDLGSGTVLVRADLVAVRARLPESAGRYLAASGPEPVGRPLSRPVGAGELLPRAALAGRVCGSEVSIPVSAQHVPATVRRGARVDVFATPRTGETSRVLSAVTVQGVTRGSAVGGEPTLVVRVADDLTPAVVSAVRTAEIDVVVAVGRDAGDGCGAPAAGAPPGSGSPSPEAAPPGEASPGESPPGTGPSEGTGPPGSPPLGSAGPSGGAVPPGDGTPGDGDQGDGDQGDGVEPPGGGAVPPCRAAEPPGGGAEPPGGGAVPSGGGAQLPGGGSARDVAGETDRSGADR
ncbi:hypothetical protein GCM10020369_50170 [Cryptosporangium minutisporangium]|uniref:SAF domain-containing protein n=2 Tax=Cryptosporangium minutisporangium TaxID=113569 RepID=A0ABP6T3I4_9ACTN